MSPHARICHRHRTLILDGQGCPSCELEQRSRRRRVDEHQAVMSGARWKRARARARRRDGGCVLADGGCEGRLEVHHRVKVVDGGEPYDLDNLVTLCRAHHELAERRRTR